MVTHPDIALWMVKQRGERIKHEVTICRLFDKQREPRVGVYQALCEFARHWFDRARSWRPARPLGQH